jgi:hypothetical protein
MAGYIYANSSWRTLQKGFVYVNGAWRSVQKGFVYANGAWKQFFTNNTVPSAVTSLSYSLISGGARISWSAPSSDGGSAITRYEVKRDSFSYFSVGLSTIYDYTLSSGTYTIYVRAVNAIGNGTESSISVTVPVPSPVITNVTASSITTATATISWSSTNQATYSIAGLPGSPLTGTTATSRAVTGLSPSTSYTATVTLANSDGATTAASVIFTTTANPNISQIVMTPGGSSTPYMTATWSATNTASVFFITYRSASSALNSPPTTFINSGFTNGSSVITNTGGLNFYYQFYLTPYSGSSGSGSAGTQRATGIKRNTTSGGPTTYNF